MKITERHIQSAASKSPRRDARLRGSAGGRTRAVADAPQPEPGGAEPTDDRMPCIQDVVEYQRDFLERSNGFYFLGREEILAIVENLFIGNRLEQGLVRVCPGCTVNLKRIRNPLVIFASDGDNITPPQQALGWIPAVFKDTEELKRAGQRIVYLINPHVGHLGIFVSAKVARLEHRAILESLDEIEGLEEARRARDAGYEQMFSLLYDDSKVGIGRMTESARSSATSPSET